MMTQREILFRPKRPSGIDPKDVEKLLAEHGEIVSFSARAGHEDLHSRKTIIWSHRLLSG